MAAVPVSAAKMAAVHTAGGGGTPPLPAEATSADSLAVDSIVPPSGFTGFNKFGEELV